MKPNGLDEKQIGSCNIYLCLLSMPSSWSEITITQTIKSLETYASHKHMQRYRREKYALSLDELKEGNYEQIAFEADIKLLSVKYNTDIVEYIYLPTFMKHTEFIWKVDAKLQL